MAEEKPGVERLRQEGVVDGVGEIALTHWREFFVFMNNVGIRFPQFIWRGQRRDALLRPTLDRRYAGLGQTELEAVYGAHLSRFKYAMRGRRPGALENDDEWWALGQQNGLETPLLDWTELPYAALYFAFRDAGRRSTDPEGDGQARVVYALHEFSVQQRWDKLHHQNLEKWADNPTPRPAFDPKDQFMSYLTQKKWERDFEKQTKPPQIRFIRPRADENVRLLSQGGLFTQAPPGADIENFIASQFRGAREYTLMKLTIPDQDREGCLTALNRMNMNHRSLFPDIHGSSTYCNLSLEIPGY